ATLKIVRKAVYIACAKAQRRKKNNRLSEQPVCGVQRRKNASWPRGDFRGRTFMANIKWGVNYSTDTLPLNDILHFASLAEEAGADVVWTAEGWRDAFVPLTATASVAKNIRVGTAIAQMARPPVLTALSALSLAEFTQGKFILGVGTAPKIWNQNWHA